MRVRKVAGGVCLVLSLSLIGYLCYAITSKEPEEKSKRQEGQKAVAQIVSTQVTQVQK